MAGDAETVNRMCSESGLYYASADDDVTKNNLTPVAWRSVAWDPPSDADQKEVPDIREAPAHITCNISCERCSNVPRGKASHDDIIRPDLSQRIAVGVMG